MAEIQNRRLRKIHDWLVHIVEDVSLRAIAGIYLTVILVSALLYFCLSLVGNGLEESTSIKSGISIWTSLYFSVVTISSLGYGDLHPIGASKIIACSEVMVGLAAMGIFISRITSRKLSFHVKRMYEANARLEFDRISRSLAVAAQQIAKSGTVLTAAYLPTPGSPTIGMQQKLSSLETFHSSLQGWRTATIDYAEYLSMECSHNSFFGIVSDEGVIRLSLFMSGAITSLGQIVIGLPSDFKHDAITPFAQKNVRESLAALEKICASVEHYAKQHQIKDAYNQLKDACAKFPNSYFTAPFSTDSLVPDQKLSNADQPVDTGRNVNDAGAAPHRGGIES